MAQIHELNTESNVGVGLDFVTDNGESTGKVGFAALAGGALEKYEETELAGKRRSVKRAIDDLAQQVDDAVEDVAALKDKVDHLSVETDTTLSVSGAPADAKAVGDKFGGFTLGTDPVTGLLYIYLNGQKIGRGIDIGAPGVDVSSIVEWYQQPVKDALSYVSSLGNDQWVHHVVMADSHYSELYNYGHSGAMVKILMSTGYFDKFVHLGDLTDKGNTSELNLAIEQVGSLNGQMLYAMGNHEVSGNKEITPYLHDAFMSNLTDNITYNPDFDASTYDNPYYIYKDTVNKIAYIHYAYFGKISNRQTEMSWVLDRVQELPEGYTIIIFMHPPVQELDNSVSEPNFHMLFGFLPEKYRRGVVLTGHIHGDRLVEWDGYREIWFAADAKYTRDPYGPEDRSEGTVNEQAISIFSIGIGTNNAVKVYRIGAVGRELTALAPNIIETSMSVNDGNNLVTGIIGSVGLLDVSNTNYKLLSKWVPVDPDSYYYIYTTDKSSVDVQRTINKAEYTDTRADTFVSGSRLAVNPQGVVELNVHKFYSKSTSNYMLVGSNNEDIASRLVVSKDPPLIPITIDDVQWVDGTVNGVGTPTSATDNKRTDRPILVEPSTTYVVSNANCSTTWVGVGMAKGPCTVLAVNQTRDVIKRVTGSSFPFTFTTTDDTHYVYIAYRGTETYDGWTLEKVEEG